MKAALLTTLLILGASVSTAAASDEHVGTLEERSAQSAAEVFCKDTDPAVEFYKLIGFEVVRQVKTFTAIRGYGIYVFLNQHEEATQGNRWVMLRIITDDVDALAADFTQKGIKFEHPLGDRYYGMREFSIVDPCGFSLRFARPI